VFKCGEEHSWTTCSATENKCPNCRGNHSANDRSRPRYKSEEKVLKIKCTNNFTFAEIVKQDGGSKSSTASTQVSSCSKFPLLIPEATSSQIQNHRSSPHKHIDSVSHSNEEMVVTEEITGLNMFNNSVHFLAFLTEVIQQTILAMQRNETIDVFRIIAEVADGNIGLALDADQLELFFT